MCVAHVALFFVVAGGTGNVGGGGLRVGEIAVCVCVFVCSLFRCAVVLACCCVPVGGGLVHEGEYAVGTGHLVGGEALYVDAVDWVLNKIEREGLRCV